jgi:hypothetical protein
MLNNLVVNLFKFLSASFLKGFSVFIPISFISLSFSQDNKGDGGGDR